MGAITYHQLRAQHARRTAVHQAAVARNRVEGRPPDEFTGGLIYAAGIAAGELREAEDRLDREWADIPAHELEPPEQYFEDGIHDDY